MLFVIKNHLDDGTILAEGDVDDPPSIAAFAELVGDAERLRHLYVHTYCDSRATSAELWNSYKDMLHNKLFLSTMERLKLGSEIDASHEAKKKMTQQELIAKNMPGISEDEISAHFSLLPDRYFIQTDADEVALHIQMVNRLLKSISAADSVGSLRPVIDWRDDLNRSITVVNIVTWDRAGLFYKLAGAFSVAGLNILGAKVISRTDHIAIDTFHVIEPGRGVVQSEATQDAFARNVEASLVSNKDLYPEIVSQSKRIAATRYLSTTDPGSPAELVSPDCRLEDRVENWRATSWTGDAQQVTLPGRMQAAEPLAQQPNSRRTYHGPCGGRLPSYHSAGSAQADPTAPIGHIHDVLPVEQSPAPQDAPEKFWSFDQTDCRGGALHEYFPAAGLRTRHGLTVGLLTDAGYRNHWTRLVRMDGEPVKPAPRRIPDPDLYSVSRPDERAQGQLFVQQTFGESLVREDREGPNPAITLPPVSSWNRRGRESRTARGEHRFNHPHRRGWRGDSLSRPRRRGVFVTTSVSRPAAICRGDLGRGRSFTRAGRLYPVQRHASTIGVWVVGFQHHGSYRHAAWEGRRAGHWSTAFAASHQHRVPR